MARKMTPEGYVKKAVTDLLDAKKIFWLRMNSSQQVFSYTNKAGEEKRRRIKGHAPGTADLLAIHRRYHYTFSELQGSGGFYWAQCLWIEVKAPGKKQRPEQVEFEKRVIDLGCDYLLVDNVDTLINWLRERGL